MRFIFYLLMILLLGACGFIEINENGYRSIPKNEMEYIKPFDSTAVYKKINNSDRLNLYEINTADIKKCIKEHKYIWLHLWRPFCTSDYCQNVNYFINIENSFNNLDFKLLLISETYEMKDIKMIVGHSSFNKPIFVLQDSYYGHKMKNNRIKLFKEINNHLSLTTNYGYDDYFFKDTLLIYAGYKISKETIDSLITNH